MFSCSKHLSFLSFLSGPVVNYWGTIIRKLALEKESTDLCKLTGNIKIWKWSSGRLNGIYANSPSTGLKLSYGCCYFKICMISSFCASLLFSLSGGSMFARLVWLKKNGNSICWVPPGRIITSASWIHKPVQGEKKRKWNWCKMALKQGKRVKTMSVSLQNQDSIVEIRNE